MAGSMHRIPRQHQARASPPGGAVCIDGIRIAAGLLALAFALRFSAVGIASDGIEPTGVSMKALARGGADVAVGDSALSQIDNPATLALSPRDLYQLDTTAELAFVDVRWRGPVDSATSERSFLPLLNTAFSIPVNERFTLGAALHSKAGFSTQYEVRHLLIPFMNRRVGSDLKVISFPVSAACKVNEKLSFGIGARAEIATAEFSTVLGPADVEFGRGYAWGGGFQLGVHYQARDDLSFGLGYRSPTWFTDLSGGRAKASLLGVVPIPLGEAAIDELQLPQKIMAGAAWDATPWLKLVGEIRWLNYSNSSLHAATIATDGLIDLRYPFPLGYRDQWAFILGGDIKLSEGWKLGVGYRYATPQVPASHLQPIGTVIAEHHATIGLRYETKRWWAGAGYIVAFPTSLHARGHSNIPLGIDYATGSLRQTQYALGIGFGYRW